MIIAVDIGNSSINIGFFEEGSLSVHSMDSYPLRLEEEYAGIVRQAMADAGMDKKIEGSIISSVVPGHTPALSGALREVAGVEPLLVSASLASWIGFDVGNPDELGADRVASAVGAVGLCGPPVVVIDFGTATTVNFISRDGIFRGGAIMPGLALMAESLGGKTALLPVVRPEKPESALGRDTGGSILSGIVFGTAGAVERIISEVEGKEGERYKVMLTGGHSDLMKDYIRHDFVEPYLTLKGMRLIYKKGDNVPRPKGDNART